jgi:Zn-dependent peptidase ImmA (M78 family)
VLEEIDDNKPKTGLSRELARKLLKEAKVKEAPISLGVLIKHLQTTRDLTVYATSAFGEKLSGMLVVVDSESLDKAHEEIHFNSNDGWHRRRFTIAHEIGHMLMNTTCDGSSASFSGGRSPTEAEANSFSAELLMPMTMVKKDLKLGTMDIPALAWKYIVSQEAMGWKVSSCI